MSTVAEIPSTHEALDGRTLAVEDPATEATVAHVARGGAAEVDRAVTAARKTVVVRRSAPWT